MGWPGPTHTRAVPLKKISGRGSAIHVGVHAFARAFVQFHGFAVAGRPRCFISAARRPNLRRVNRNQPAMPQ